MIQIKPGWLMIWGVPNSDVICGYNHTPIKEPGGEWHPGLTCKVLCIRLRSQEATKTFRNDGRNQQEMRYLVMRGMWWCCFSCGDIMCGNLGVQPELDGVNPTVLTVFFPKTKRWRGPFISLDIYTVPLYWRVKKGFPWCVFCSSSPWNLWFWW